VTRCCSLLPYEFLVRMGCSMGRGNTHGSVVAGMTETGRLLFPYTVGPTWVTFSLSVLVFTRVEIILLVTRCCSLLPYEFLVRMGCPMERGNTHGSMVGGMPETGRLLFPYTVGPTWVTFSLSVLVFTQLGVG